VEKGGREGGSHTGHGTDLQGPCQLGGPWGGMGVQEEHDQELWSPRTQSHSHTHTHKHMLHTYIYTHVYTHTPRSPAETCARVLWVPISWYLSPRPDTGGSCKDAGVITQPRAGLLQLPETGCGPFSQRQTACSASRSGVPRALTEHMPSPSGVVVKRTWWHWHTVSILHIGST
jgi:hypothetical protein